MPEQDNRYNERTVFRDNNSHFLRMSKGDVERYFGPEGPVARVDSVPNWAERTEDGSYELVSPDGNNEVVHRWGIFFSMEVKPVAKYEAGKGKAVATWDYRISVPSADANHAYQFYSEDRLKYVFAWPGGLASAIPPRMRQMHQQISTLKFRTKTGDVPLMPYVNLVFYMWLEEDEKGGWPVFEWLIENMEGWRDSYQA